MANTKISITEGIGVIDKNKLNISELLKNTEYTKLAYCIKVSVGTDSYGKPFFKFNIADRCGKVIIGRLFNAEDSYSKGVIANNMVNRVVKITFSVNVFNGHESIIIKSIEPVKEEIISREEFIGELSNIDSDITCFNKFVGIVKNKFPYIGLLIDKKDLLIGLDKYSIPDLYAGRRGGFVKFASKLFSMIESAFNDSDKLESLLAVALLSELFMREKYNINYEDDVLSLGENVGKLLSNAESYINGSLNFAKNKNDEYTVKVCREAKHLLHCYFGYEEPDTFITKSICAIRESLRQAIILEDIYDSMLIGTRKSVERDDGTYYNLVKI